MAGGRVLEESAAASENRVKVLVVDDEQGVLNSTHLLLSEMGFDVVTTTDAGAVIDTMRKEKPDVLLQDIWMPGLDVDALIAAIRKDPDVGGTPVLLFSAGIDLEEIQARTGAAGFLEKPFRPAEVVKAIESVLAAKERP